MGQIGRFIDNATDAERDRVIEGMGWCEDWVGRGDQSGCRCLIGHMKNFERHEDINIPIMGLDGQYVVGMRVMYLFDRFTIDHIVPMLKARAAKNNHVDTSAQPVNRLNRIAAL